MQVIQKCTETKDFFPDILYMYGSILCQRYCMGIIRECFHWLQNVDSILHPDKSQGFIKAHSQVKVNPLYFKCRIKPRRTWMPLWYYQNYNYFLRVKCDPFYRNETLLCKNPNGDMAENTFGGCFCQFWDFFKIIIVMCY